MANAARKSAARAVQRASAPSGVEVPVVEFDDVLELLINDHRRVCEMFDDFEARRPWDDAAAQIVRAQAICMELALHTSVEEEIFYPAARAAVADAGADVLDEACVEHSVAKDLIAEIMSMSPDEPLFDARIKVLGEYVRHHIAEEEGVLFPMVRDSGLDLADLAIQLARRRVELGAEIGAQISG
jgi:iron-sulfur cluster repair protein YtfE (RIC family)